MRKSQSVIQQSSVTLVLVVQPLQKLVSENTTDKMIVKIDIGNREE
jgi:hypothetical protein